MKMYTVPKGTPALLIRNFADTRVNGEMTSEKWETRKELNFFDTVMDPVRVMNGHTHDIPLVDGLAAAGYAVFVDMDAPEFALAVEFNKVRVQ